MNGNNGNRYHHPFTPYGIQVDLMDAIYDTLSNNYKVGIFESPTGTGKTLSVICSTMTWLRDYKKSNTFQETEPSNGRVDNDKRAPKSVDTPSPAQLSSTLIDCKNIDNGPQKQPYQVPLVGNSSSANHVSEGDSGVSNTEKFTDIDFDSDFSDTDVSEDEPEWVKSNYKNTIISRSKAKIKDYEVYLDKIQSDYQNNLVDVETLPEVKRSKRSKPAGDDPDLQYLPDDYFSDSEVTISNVEYENSMITKQINQLLQKSEDRVELINECPINIYFTSRTHSQLNQFAHQLSLPSFDSSFEDLSERTKYLPMGSRKQLCINEKVNKFGDAAINDACIDLQKKQGGCEFLTKDENLSKKFVDLSLTKIHDIEDLAHLGANLKVCPYYSVREGLQLTEIISLPYQMLLQDSTRDILNLNIEDSIIVIDEAHNLLDTITSLYSVSITIDELSEIIKSLKIYLSKFIRRLNSGNRINLTKLIKLCQILIDFINSKTKDNSAVVGQQIEVDTILASSNADLYNIHKMEAFLQKSKIAFKIETYLEKTDETKRSSSNPLLFKIIKFLKCLNHPSKEGRFFWSETKGIKTINYMLLDPSVVFNQILEKAKCVLLCGGTMEPISDYYSYLFPNLPKDQVKTFKCGHIIPKENLKVFPITSWNNNIFEFLYGKRNDRNMIMSLGELILTLSKTIPSGMVVFFPSYSYLEQVVDIWKSCQLYEKIDKSKKVLQEPTGSTKVEQVLQEYSSIIREDHQGSLLLSVVGGKMSEGINFSDDLARAVLMVGLPYPNAFSGEIIAKRKFIESTTIAKGGTRQEAKENSQNFYDNICMRAVNQSIGRSIRHINDYSTIYLIDQRYAHLAVQQKLSGWVRERISKSKLTEDETIHQTKDFFLSKSINRWAE